MSTEQAAEKQSEPQDVTQDPEERVQELEERVEYLEEQLKQRTPKQAVNFVIASLTGANVDMNADPVDNLEAVRDFNDRFVDLETAVSRHGTVIEEQESVSCDPRVDAWERIVQAAENLRNDPNHALPDDRVQLYKDNIAQATGKSERQAQNYIEEFGEDVDGASWKPYERATPGKPAKRKRLVVDLSVWGDRND